MSSTQTAQQFLDAKLPIASSPKNRRDVIRDALDMLPRPGIWLLSTPKLVMPYGEWELDADNDGACIRLPDHAITLDLNGCGIKRPPDATGIHVPVLAGRSTVRGERAVISNREPSQLRGVGIRVEGFGCDIENVIVREAGIGFQFVGSVPTGNVNLTSARRLQALSCDTGFHVDGSDANACEFISCLVYQCRDGLVDEGFLGNYFQGWCFEAVSERAIWIGDRKRAWYDATQAWDEERPGAIPFYGSNASTYVHMHLELGCGHALPGYAEYAAAGIGIHPLSVDARRAPKSLSIGPQAALWQHGDRIGCGYSRLNFRVDRINADMSIDSVHVEMPEISGPSAFRADYTGRAPYSLGWRHQLGHPRDFGLFRDDQNRLRGPAIGVTDARAADGDDVRVNANYDAGRKVPT